MITRRTIMHRRHDHGHARTTMATIITMTSIAITTIITAIPMLMTTNKPPASRGGADAIGKPRTSAPMLRRSRGREAAALYRLMTWLSPSFPVGAFSYSSGIEWAVEAGDIVDAASLAGLAGRDAGGWSGILRRRVSGAGAPRRVVGRSMRRLRDIAELAAAFVPSRERQLETSAQGRAFIEIARAAWNCDGLDQMIAACDGADRLSRRGRPRQRRACDPARADDARLPSCAGLELDIRRRAAGSARADRQPARAGVAGAGRRRDRQARALDASLDDLGSATFRADLASMRHETQYTRLFRS